MSSRKVIADSDRPAASDPDTYANSAPAASSERGAPAENGHAEVSLHRDEPNESDKWLTIEHFASDSGQTGRVALRGDTRHRVGGNKAPDDPTALAPQAHGQAKEKWPLTLDEIIKQTLVRLLRETGGNRRRTASLLGISRSTLYRMLARYHIDHVGRSTLSPRSRIGPPVPPACQ
jgi:Bacterial regulatory protein, Fis family